MRHKDSGISLLSGRARRCARFALRPRHTQGHEDTETLGTTTQRQSDTEHTDTGTHSATQRHENTRTPGHRDTGAQQRRDTGTHTDTTQTERYRDTGIKRQWETYAQRHRDGDRLTQDGDAETQGHTQTETQRHRNKGTQSHRDPDTQRPRDTQTQGHTQQHRDKETL